MVSICNMTRQRGTLAKRRKFVKVAENFGIKQFATQTRNCVIPLGEVSPIKHFIYLQGWLFMCVYILSYAEE